MDGIEPGLLPVLNAGSSTDARVFHAVQAVVEVSVGAAGFQLFDKHPNARLAVGRLGVEQQLVRCHDCKIERSFWDIDPDEKWKIFHGFETGYVPDWASWLSHTQYLTNGPRTRISIWVLCHSKPTGAWTNPLVLPSRTRWSIPVGTYTLTLRVYQVKNILKYL